MSLPPGSVLKTLGLGVGPASLLQKLVALMWFACVHNDMLGVWQSVPAGVPRAVSGACDNSIPGQGTGEYIG